MRVAEDDGQAFLREIQARRGGNITWRTYATWYADSLGHVRQYGVFLYMVNGQFWFEDFDREPSLFGMKLPEKKDREPYVKLEDSFLPSDVVSVVRVLKKDAESFAMGYRHSVKQAGSLSSFFSSTVSMVTFNDGTVRFFELIKGSGFNELIKES